jgi:hypothetical protein
VAERPQPVEAEAQSLKRSLVMMCEAEGTEPLELLVGGEMLSTMALMTTHRAMQVLRKLAKEERTASAVEADKYTPVAAAMAEHTYYKCLATADETALHSLAAAAPAAAGDPSLIARRRRLDPHHSFALGRML